MLNFDKEIDVEDDRKRKYYETIIRKVSKNQFLTLYTTTTASICLLIPISVVFLSAPYNQCFSNIKRSRSFITNCRVGWTTMIFDYHGTTVLDFPEPVAASIAKCLKSWLTSILTSTLVPISFPITTSPFDANFLSSASVANLAGVNGGENGTSDHFCDLRVCMHY